MGRVEFPLFRSWLLVAGSLLVLHPFLKAGETESQDRLTDGDRLIIETIQRIENYDLGSAPNKVKKAVDAYLDSKKGSAEYLEFIGKYGLADRTEELIALAVDRPGKAEGVRSVDLLLRFGKLEELEALLHREGSPGNPIVEAVGLSGHRNRFELLEKWLADESLPGSLRAKALKAVGNTGPGAKQLLRLAADGKIPAELKFAAGSVLFASPDPKVAEAAEAHFTRPKTVSEEALPPIHELVKMEGTLSSGKMVFGQICIACHQVGDQGLDYGPALTEIGNKLAKEALYTAILDPNEAISFGYEGFTVKTKDGTELSGFIASDTADQLSLKLPGGLKVDIPKGDIQKKTALPISLMPANLQASLTTQQLVDLVAYLASLKGSK